VASGATTAEFGPGAAEYRSRAGLGGVGQRPTNVGTAAAVGAQTGYQLSWLALLIQAVTSAQDAAGALRPLAGSLAADLFAAGLVTSAVVACRSSWRPPHTWSAAAGARGGLDGAEFGCRRVIPAG
jgi:hypothetical protein